MKNKTGKISAGLEKTRRDRGRHDRIELVETEQNWASDNHELRRSLSSKILQITL